MDYTGYNCPVCNEVFKKGDDIVVCPECGTPSHRECYESNGKCINLHKHIENYDYRQDITNKNDTDTNHNSDSIVCNRCGSVNEKDALICKVCNHPIKNEQVAPHTPTPQKRQMLEPSPFTVYDPMAGFTKDDDMGDGVTAGELAKYVKNSTPYFLVIFYNIKNYAKSRFNFAAAIFGGGYLLFRKMYKIGTFITILQAAILILSSFLNYLIISNPVYTDLLEAAQMYQLDTYEQAMANLTSGELVVFFLYFALSFVYLVMRIVIGACTNRMYFNHCKKSIVKIKSNNSDENKIDEELKSKGGVNVKLAISLFVTYMLIQYVPLYFM